MFQMNGERCESCLPKCCEKHFCYPKVAEETFPVSCYFCHSILQSKCFRVGFMGLTIVQAHFLVGLALFEFGLAPGAGPGQGCSVPDRDGPCRPQWFGRAGPARPPTPHLYRQGPAPALGLANRSEGPARPGPARPKTTGRHGRSRSGTEHPCNEAFPLLPPSH